MLLILLPFIVFWQLWAPNPADRVLFIGDILVQAYPSRSLVHQMLMQGETPLWNPYQLGGMPLLGDVQVAVYYLPNLILSWLSAGRAIDYISFQMLVIAHYALAGVLMFGFLRGLGVPAMAALVGAIAFEFNGFFIGHRGHYNMLAVVAWVPGVLLLLDQAWRARSGWTGLIWAVLAGLALSQLLMAGHPQLAFYSVLFIGSYFLFRWAVPLRTWPIWRRASWGERWRGPLVRVPLLFGVAAVLAGGISAIALLPAAELLGRSLRSDLTFAFTAEFPLLPRNLITLFVPEFLNWSGTEFRIYAGILTLVLALVAWVVPSVARPERAFFGVVAVVSLLGALGAFTALHGILYRFVPGFDAVRVAARLFYFGNFSLAVLAAFGAEVLFRRMRVSELSRLRGLVQSSKWFVMLAALTAVIFYTLLVFYYRPVSDAFYAYGQLFPFNRPLGPGEENRFELLTHSTNMFMLFFVFLLAALGILLLRARRRLLGGGLVLATAALMTIDLATFAPYHDTYPADPIADTLGITGFNVRTLTWWQAQDQAVLLERLREMPDGMRVDNSDAVLADNYSQIWRIPFSTGYNILDLDVRHSLRNHWPLLTPAQERDLMNVGYVLTWPENPESPEEGAELVLENSQGRLWRRAEPPAYAHFSTRVRPAETLMTVNGLLAFLPQTLREQPAVALERGSLRETLAAFWPETVQADLYRIGQTGVSSPVDISVLAGGQGAYSAVMVDGVTVTPAQRGIILAVIDVESGSVLASGGFDTFASQVESDRAAALIDAAPPGAIVALATYDEGTAQLTDRFRASLETLGATESLREAGQAYALIGVKGSRPGTVPESLGAEARVLDVGAGVAPGADASFSSRILSYEANRIVLLAEADAPGLLTIGETYYPGWEAYIDGHQTPVLRANGMLRGVVLPPGNHEVTLIYNPLSYRFGAAASLTSLLLALGLLAVAVVMQLLRRRKQHSTF